MPYRPHDDLIFSLPGFARVWRFLDLPKFLSLLHSRALFFTRTDLFEDPYEGMMPDKMAMFARLAGANLEEEVSVLAQNREDFYVNCWHVSEHESAAMWKLYSNNDGGVAIRTCVVNLQKAFENVSEDVFIGEVQYSDKSVWGNFSFFKFLLTKRPSFAHERELRVLLCRPDTLSVLRYRKDDGSRRATPVSPPPTPPGVALPVDLSTLVEEIVVSPSAPSWLPDVLRDVLKRYNYDWPVAVSNLYKLSYLET